MFLLALEYTQLDTKERDCFILAKPRVYEAVSAVGTKHFYGLGSINITTRTFALRYSQFPTGKTLRYY